MNIVRLMLLSRQMKNRRHEKDNMVTGIPPLTFTAKKTGTLKNYRIYGNTVDGESVGNLVTDSHSEHYGEYAIPITNNSETANIYLDKPLKKVGSEAEYIDYATQKWQKVRKNLFKNQGTSNTMNGVTFTVNDDSSVTCNGTCANGIASFYIRKRATFYDETIQYTLTGCPVGGRYNSTYVLEYSNAVNNSRQDLGNGVSFTPYRKADYPNAWVRIMIFPGYTCNNLTFYPMIRKADIMDNTYEPYIENTEVDVILPRIAVTAGTNTLTVGTEVQPSRVELTGIIKEGES